MLTAAVVVLAFLGAILYAAIGFSTAILQDDESLLVNAMIIVFWPVWVVFSVFRKETQ